MSEMKDKVVNKAVIKAADKVRKVDNTWNRTIAGGIAGASIGLLTSPNIGKKIAGTFQSAKTKVKGKDLGGSVKQMKDQTINLVQDKLKKDKSSDEDNSTENQEEKNENVTNQNDNNNKDNQNDKNNQDKQDDSNNQDNQNYKNNQDNQDDNNNQDNQKDQSSQNNQANETLRDENEHLKQKIEELENKLNQLMNDSSSKEEDAENSNGITIVRQDDVTK
ncbi:hypothetical protein [Terribacillus saccharophilus]|uniref:hypothetical protein n=1 Tax=Terribacillus saccharophilus TaxID=361277 RepID=UPI001140DF65|nr:hypothetical protein [Terribacillus saccharophilus]